MNERGKKKMRTTSPDTVKDDRMHFRVDPSLKTLIKEAAKRDHRSMSQWVELLIRRELEKKTEH